MKADARGCGQRNGNLGQRRRWWRLHFFDKHRLIALRLAALMAEARVGRKLCAAGTNVRHASSVSRYAETCDPLL